MNTEKDTSENGKRKKLDCTFLVDSHSGEKCPLSSVVGQKTASHTTEINIEASKLN